MCHARRRAFHALWCAARDAGRCRRPRARRTEPACTIHTWYTHELPRAVCGAGRCRRRRARRAGRTRPGAAPCCPRMARSLRPTWRASSARGRVRVAAIRAPSSPFTYGTATHQRACAACACGDLTLLVPLWPALLHNLSPINARTRAAGIPLTKLVESEVDKVRAAAPLSKEVQEGPRSTRQGCKRARAVFRRCCLPLDALTPPPLKWPPCIMPHIHHAPPYKEHRPHAKQTHVLPLPRTCAGAAPV